MWIAVPTENKIFVEKSINIIKTGKNEDILTKSVTNISTSMIFHRLSRLFDVDNIIIHGL